MLVEENGQMADRVLLVLKSEKRAMSAGDLVAAGANKNIRGLRSCLTRLKNAKKVTKKAVKRDGVSVVLYSLDDKFYDLEGKAKKTKKSTVNNPILRHYLNMIDAEAVK